MHPPVRVAGHAIASAAVAFAVAACDAADIADVCQGASPEAAAEIRVGNDVNVLTETPDSALMLDGNTLQLSVGMFRRNATCSLEPANPPATVAWSVSPGTVATVFGGGVVHARASGAATVVAAVGETVDTLRLRIVPQPSLPGFASLVAGDEQTCGRAMDGTIYCWGRGLPNLCTDAGGASSCGLDYTLGWDRSQWPGNLLSSCREDDPSFWEASAYPNDAACSRVPSRVTFPQTLVSLDLGRSLCGLTTSGMPTCVPLESWYGGAEFTPVAGSPGLIALAVGSVHVCALDATGIAYCWGDGSGGALGDGKTSTRSTAAPVASEQRFLAVRTGYHFSCGLATDNLVYCWGAGWAGQVGPEAIDTCVTGGQASTAYPCSLIPRPVSDTTFKDLAVGSRHACGLDLDGTAYCWGSNLNGALGDGTATLHSTPLPVSGDLVFGSLTGGEGHTCGLTVAGAAYCWGANYNGALGHPGIDESPVPVAVEGGLTFASLVAGLGHTCGLTSDGVAYCWGWNQMGQLGNGGLESRLAPTRIRGH